MRVVSFIILDFVFFVVNYEAYDAGTKLLFSDFYTVNILDTETGNVTVVAAGYQRILFIDFDSRSSFIYWSDYYGGTISRIKYLADVTTNPVIVAKGISPTGIAVDATNDYLYWADMGENVIYKSRLDGTNQTAIVNDITNPLDLELDALNGWIYYVSDLKQIGKCRLDGSDRQIILTGISTSENIELDLISTRIYWSEISANNLKSAYLNGSDIQLILNGVDVYMWGIAIDTSSIYFSTLWSANIYKMVKTDPTNVQHLYSSNSGQLSDVKMLNDEAECTRYSVIRNENKRSAGYVLDFSLDQPFSDHGLDEGWYRIMNDNGQRMPTSPPGEFHCGTYFPIWLKGYYPEPYERNFTTEACRQTSSNTCEERLNITISDCGSFVVYYLRNTTENAAYCFGSGPVRCADGLSSESGYYPGCSPSFPNEIITPAVEAVLVDGPIHNIGSYGPSPSLEPVFKCRFNDVSNGTYVYDVYWYINGDSVTFFKNVLFSDINETVLRGTHWTDSYHLNMEVQCSLRVRNSIASIPSPFYNSSVFKAGLYPEKYKYTVIEGESIIITFTSTVPVGCFTSHPEVRAAQCSQNVYISQPKFEFNTATCSNNIANRDIVFKARYCGIKIGSIDWNETNYLQVYGFSDGLYNQQDRRTYIRLTTKANTIWQNLHVPDIQVNVLDKDSVLTTRVCQSYNDPHITTYDGKTYHYMEVGEFVMYRNERGPYWVHALLTNCGFGWAGSSCHCGIAVRSRRSLFVLRTCERISRTKQYLLPQPLTDVRSCDDNDLSIEHTSNSYKITLPIGTDIQFSISPWSKFITNISIKPSIYDINMAKGLCGVPSETKDVSDDFTHRQLGPINEEKNFADSWRINSTTFPKEQLFVLEPAFLSETSSNDIGIVIGSSNITQERYCACENEAGTGEDLDLFYTLQCNLTESTESCLSAMQSQEANENSISAFVTSCSPGYRTKRSIGQVHRIQRRSTSDTDDIIDVQPLEYDDDTDVEVAEPEFRNGWTVEEANKTCYERIHQAIPEDLFGEMTGLTDSDYIESCILDIKLTADTSFVQDTVGAMQTYTVMEVLRNETLSVMKTEDGNQTILEYLTSQLCPNNCSENGNCTKGLCSCYNGYIGNDCSQDISKPPLNISLPAEGLCGTRSRACQRTNVYGTFLSTNVWCRKRHFELINDTKVYTADPIIIKADYRNTFMVSVDLEGSRRKRAVDHVVVEGYDLSLSNDGEQFGENISIVIYDEDCFSCNSPPVTCTTLDTCPMYITSTELESTTEVTTAHTESLKRQSMTTTEKETSTQSMSTTLSTAIQDPTTTIDTITEHETTQQTTTKVTTIEEEQTTTSKPTTEQETTSGTDTISLTITEQLSTSKPITTDKKTSSKTKTLTSSTEPRTITTSPAVDATTSHKSSTERTTTESDDTGLSTGTNKLTSYIGPIVLGASIVILLAIVTIVCVCLKFKRGKQRFQDEQTRNITQFNSWNIYKGSSSIVSKDMQAEKQWKIYNGNSNGDNDDKHRNLIPPEFRFAARMNSGATATHQIRLPLEKNRKSFFDYYLQK